MCQVVNDETDTVLRYQRDENGGYQSYLSFVMGTYMTEHTFGNTIRACMLTRNEIGKTIDWHIQTRKVSFFLNPYWNMYMNGPSNLYIFQGYYVQATPKLVGSEWSFSASLEEMI